MSVGCRDLGVEMYGLKYMCETVRLHTHWMVGSPTSTDVGEPAHGIQPIRLLDGLSVSFTCNVRALLVMMLMNVMFVH